MFENRALQDLRALVTERSTMRTYIRGENVEVPLESIGILLEGFVKSQGQLIKSPAVIFPSQGLQSFQSVDISQGYLNSVL